MKTENKYYHKFATQQTTKDNSNTAVVLTMSVIIVISFVLQMMFN